MYIYLQSVLLAASGKMPHPTEGGKISQLAPWSSSMGVQCVNYIHTPASSKPCDVSRPNQIHARGGCILEGDSVVLKFFGGLLSVYLK